VPLPMNLIKLWGGKGPEGKVKLAFRKEETRGSCETKWGESLGRRKHHRKKIRDESNSSKSSIATGKGKPRDREGEIQAQKKKEGKKSVVHKERPITQ